MIRVITIPIIREITNSVIMSAEGEEIPENALFDDLGDALLDDLGEALIDDN